MGANWVLRVHLHHKTNISCGDSKLVFINSNREEYKKAETDCNTQ